MYIINALSNPHNRIIWLEADPSCQEFDNLKMSKYPQAMYVPYTIACLLSKPEVLPDIAFVVGKASLEKAQFAVYAGMVFIEF